MSDKIAKYTSEDIRTISDKDHIRLNPPGYVTTTDQYGQFHSWKEVVDNAVDEVSLIPEASVDLYFFQDRSKNTYQTVVIDNGRGFPQDRLYDSITKLKTSGKFDARAYQKSSGLFGFGLTVATALSNRYRVISARDGKVLSVDNLDDSPEPTQSALCSTERANGTVVVLDPAVQYFTEVEEFMREGYKRMTHFLKILSIFNSVAHTDPPSPKYSLYLIPKPIDRSFWTLPPDRAYTFIQDTYKHYAVPVYNSLEAIDTEKFLSAMWETGSSFIWKDLTTLQRAFAPTLDLVNIRKPEEGYRSMGYDIRLYLPKSMKMSQSLSLVNNVVIKSQANSHVQMLHSALKEVLGTRIEDPKLRTYFETIYDLPICAAMDIGYTGAKFSGITKDGFKMEVFEKRFREYILAQMLAKDEFEWDLLYSYIEEHLNKSFKDYYAKPSSTSKSDSWNLKTEFYDCESDSPEEAEMFIVEGSSAAHIKTARDPKTQAVYLIEGKPQNVSSGKDAQDVAMSRLLKFKPYQDLMKFINVKPEHPNLDSCRFKMIIISTDADSDGYHIAASHVNALYTINPLLILEGRVYVANPPLYEVTPVGRSHSAPILIRDEWNFKAFKADMYKHFIEVKYKHRDYTGHPNLITEDLFKGFCLVVMEIGEYLQGYAAQFAMPPAIIERLAYISRYLGDRNTPPDLEVLRHYLGKRVWYNERFNTLTIENDPTDITVSLASFREQLYSGILARFKKYGCDKIDLYVTVNPPSSNKDIPLIVKDQRMSFMDLYALFLQFDKMIEVKRHKGLAGMGTEDLEMAFTDKKTRNLKRITSLGDLDVIYGMLGDDASMRRLLVADIGQE